MSADSRRGPLPFEVGGGQVVLSADGRIRLSIPAKPSGYADAQLDDYRSLPRSQFQWRPPVELSLRARASLPTPEGTLGFGFWNDPFTLSFGQGGAARRLPAAPNAVWFFYGSAPNDLSFDPGLPGHGWKAMTISTPAVPALLLAPLAGLAFTLSRFPALRRRIVPAAIGMLETRQAPLAVSLDKWHRYRLRWEASTVRFEIDGNLALSAKTHILGPLGFVLWIDNQYAVFSAQEKMRFGVIPTSSGQWLEVADLHLQRS